VDLAARGRELAPVVADVKRRFQARHAGTGFGFPSRWDYGRFSVAYERAEKGGSVLDVGVGSGQLVNSLALGGEFTRVCGIDVHVHSKFTRFSEDFELRTMSVADMDFADGEFDTVLCMEVLEHLDPDLLESALSELRRVAAAQLIMTVPYDEPEPLPEYHRSRFGDGELRRLFPEASTALLMKPKLPWVLIEERFA
jgi:SAM-dependent methyltransferase